MCGTWTYKRMLDVEKGGGRGRGGEGGEGGGGGEV